MPLDFPIDDIDLFPDASEPSQPGRGKDLAIKAILAWLDTQPQSLWMHYLRSRQFESDTLDREIGIRLATHPALDTANARLLFWKLFRHYPYFGARSEQTRPGKGLAALEMSLCTLAGRIEGPQLDPSPLELSAGELRGFLTTFEVARTKARARGWRRRDAPFVIPDTLFHPHRGTPAAVPDSFPAPSDPAQAALVMAHAGFALADIQASDRSAIALKRQGRHWSTLIWVAGGVALGTVAFSRRPTGLILGPV
ncbi:MAG: hypothetical protein VXW58_18545 [Pseudomonadota bacterium]|nr:hypothetical protein [Pseudomonadota bacterium]